MEIQFNNLCNRQRYNLIENILGYWEGQKSNKDLYDLAITVLATPATQVTVEKAFSGLAKILTPLRTRLSKETLNKIRIIKLNKELCDSVTFNHIIENIIENEEK